MVAVIHPHHVISQLAVIILSFAIGAVVFALLGMNAFPILIGLGLLAAALCAALYFSELFVTITLTDKGIRYERGMLGKRTVLIPYEMISDAQCTQTFIERIFGVGTILINTAGTGMVELTQSNIRQPDIMLILEEIEKHAGKKRE